MIEYEISNQSYARYLKGDRNLHTVTFFSFFLQANSLIIIVFEI